MDITTRMPYFSSCEVLVITSHYTSVNTSGILKVNTTVTVAPLSTGTIFIKVITLELVLVNDENLVAGVVVHEIFSTNGHRLQKFDQKRVIR